jgi:hypothetical protein
MYGGKDVNSTMAIFLLKANHKMNDGSQVNVNIDNRKLYVTNLPQRLSGGMESTPETDTSS